MFGVLCCLLQQVGYNSSCLKLIQFEEEIINIVAKKKREDEQEKTNMVTNNKYKITKSDLKIIIPQLSVVSNG